MISAWKANCLTELLVLVRRSISRSPEVPPIPQQLLDHDLLVGGKPLLEPVHCCGWYAGHLDGSAYLTDLKTVAWEMPIGVRIALRFDEREPVLVVAEGSLDFHTHQVLYNDGYFSIESEYENEHRGQVLDDSTRPRKGTPDRDERMHEWIREHARPLSEQR